MSQKLKINPLTKQDVAVFNDGKRYSKSLKGIAVRRGDETLAIAGVLHSSPLIVFSEMKDDMRQYPVMIMKTAKRLKEIMNSYSQTLFALADKDERDAAGFLKHLGFEFVSEDENGEYYKWVRHSNH